MKNKILISILLCCLLLFIDCNKRLIGRVVLKGILTDYFNNKPITAKIYINGKKIWDTIRKSDEVGLATSKTDNLGNFNIKVRAVKSNRYILRYFVYGSNSNTFLYIGYMGNLTIPEYKTLDLGTINTREHLFYYKLFVNHTDPNTDCFSMQINPPEDYVNFCGGIGTSTVLIGRAIVSKISFDKNDSIKLGYFVSSANKNNGVGLSVPVSRVGDTSYATINF